MKIDAEEYISPKLHQSFPVGPEENKTPSVKIQIPLRLKGTGDINETLRAKLALIKRFNLADPKRLLEMFRCRSEKRDISADALKYLNGLWTESILDDLDLTELFVCYLPKVIEDQKDSFLEAIDPQPAINKKTYGEKYRQFIIYNVHKSAKEVRRFVLPRVRAKLALREVICLITMDAERVSELISLSPKYLSCPQIVDMIFNYRLGKISGDLEIAREKEKNLSLISKAVRGPKKQQKRKYGYWEIDFYFNEVLACIKSAAEIDNSAHKVDYIDKVVMTWNIPERYRSLISGEVKNPVEITLEIMVTKGMIKDPSTFRNVISPHVKKIKEKYPSLRACDYLVEHLLDWPMTEPDRLARMDIWTQLENFTFDLTDSEIEAGHAISYPTTIIGV